MTSRRESKLRRWAIRGVAAIALGIAVLVFWRPLVGWFASASASDGAGAGRSQAARAEGGSAGEIAWYTCPMHPSVRQHAPGQCPICGMDLQPVTKASLRSGEVQLDEAHQQRIGLRTEPVVRAPMKRDLHALGRVTVDETTLEDVTLRVKGWIQALRVNTTGQRVKRGELLFTLYSPELLAAQQEYLLALEHRAGDEGLARAAKAKLRLLGLSEAQLARLAKEGKPREDVPFFAPVSGFILEKDVVEGAAVEPGQRLYRIASLDRLWIEVSVFEGDLPNVQTGQQAAISLPSLPGKTFTGKVTYVYPVLDGNTRTGRVRIEVDNRDAALKPEMYADVELLREAEPGLQVPASAVLYTGPRRIVFVDKGGGRLVPREVVLGARAGSFYEVLDGLKEGDRVVTQGTFLVAAESRIQSATGFWSGDAR